MGYAVVRGAGFIFYWNEVKTFEVTNYFVSMLYLVPVFSLHFQIKTRGNLHQFLAFGTKLLHANEETQL